MKLALEPFDRTVLAIAACLLLMITGVVLWGDHVGAAVLSMAPASGDQTSATTAIRITFGQTMDASSVEQHFALDPPAGGHARWDGDTFIFTPNYALQPQTRYTATLAAGAQSTNGQRTLNDVARSFMPRLPEVLYLALDKPDTYALFRRALDGSPPRKIYAPEQIILSYAPSADGSQIAVALMRDHSGADLWLTDGEGKNPRKVLDCAPGSCANAEWSPDGTLIAYERQDVAPTGQLGATRTYLFSVASGTTAPAAPDNQVLGYSPLWSADGGRLAFYDPAFAGIQVLNRATGKLDAIPTLTGLMGTFAPDGKAMVYINAEPDDTTGHTQLWIDWFDLKDGMGPLLAQSADDRAPAWSPDNGWIAFARHDLDPQAGFGGQFMLYHVASGKLRQLTTDSDYDYGDFRWDANGNRLLLQRLSLKANAMESGLWVYDLAHDSLAPLALGGLVARWIQ